MDGALTGIWKKLSDFFNEILFLKPTKSLLEKVFGNSQLESVKKFTYMNADTSGASKGMLNQFWTTVSAIYDVILPIGFALIITFFIIYMVSKFTADNITFEHLAKDMITLVVVITIANNSIGIMNSMIALSDGIVSKVETAAAGTSGSSNKDDKGEIDKQVEETAKTMVDEQGMGALIEALLLWLLHQIAVIALDLALFTRMLDVGWRAALMPIGISDMFEGGVNSHGIRYLKGFLGALLSGAMVYIIAILGMSISLGMLKDAATGGHVVTGLFEAIAVQLGMVGACMGASTKVKELIGG